MNPLFTKELESDLLTAKGYLWFLAASIIFSVLAYLFLTNTELSLMDQNTMVFYLMEAVLFLDILRAIVYGSDSFAGEMERGTMEVLLLAPIKRTSIAFGKFAAAVVNWLILLIISIPYLLVVGKGSQNVAVAIAYLFLLGTLAMAIFTAFSMILSIKLKSVKNALLIGILALFFLGSIIIFPSTLKSSPVGQIFNFVNPVAAAVSTFDSAVIDNEGIGMQAGRIAVIAIYLLLMIALLIRVINKNELIGGGR
jgi:ABC-type transport system involved in multi-copper enzyme maturation permease subunit